MDASCLPVRESIRRDGYFHGVLEWKVIDLQTNKTMFNSRVYTHGNVNLGEYIAIIDALSLLRGIGDDNTPVYSDSLTAIAWFKKRKVKSKHPVNESTGPIMGCLKAAMEWQLTNRPTNPVLFWDKAIWDENPADFGRK